MKRVIFSVLASMALLSCSASLQSMGYLKKMRSWIPSYASGAAVFSALPWGSMAGGGIFGAVAYMLAYRQGVFKDAQEKYVRRESSQEKAAGESWSACADYDSLMIEDTEGRPSHADVFVCFDRKGDALADWARGVEADWIRGVKWQASYLVAGGITTYCYTNREVGCIVSREQSSKERLDFGRPDRVYYTITICEGALAELRKDLESGKKIVKAADLPASLQKLPDVITRKIIAKYARALKKDPTLSTHQAGELWNKAQEARKKYAPWWFHLQYGGFFILSGAWLAARILKA